MQSKHSHLPRMTDSRLTRRVCVRRCVCGDANLSSCALQMPSVLSQPVPHPALAHGHADNAMFRNVHTLFVIVCVFPLTTYTCERCNSALKRLKTRAALAQHGHAAPLWLDCVEFVSGLTDISRKGH